VKECSGDCVRRRHQIFLTTLDDIPKLDAILTLYERASGDRINKSKSKALALGNWSKSINVKDIPYQDNIHTRTHHHGHNTTVKRRKLETDNRYELSESFR
jgi:hypothetical protein